VVRALGSAILEWLPALGKHPALNASTSGAVVSRETKGAPARIDASTKLGINDVADQLKWLRGELPKKIAITLDGRPL
jgi:hypothetical protein